MLTTKEVRSVKVCRAHKPGKSKYFASAQLEVYVLQKISAV